MTDAYDLIAIIASAELTGEGATELASFFGHRSLIIEKKPPGRHGHHDRRRSDQDIARSRALCTPDSRSATSTACR